MKKLSVLIFCLLMTGGVAMAGFENHPNLANLNTFTASIIQTISDSQAAYFTANGKYFQGLWLLGDVQVDGTTDETVINTSHPDDQEFSWRDFNPAVFKNNLKIPVNVCIDVYQHPMGWGWILKAELWMDGLGPDAYGREGSHWFYQHHDGPRNFPGITDEWIVLLDE